MYYDFHMHSCLSPCAENEMTPNNICNMALIKGLDCIAVSDHNSTRQLASLHEVAKNLPLRLIYGCELQSSEEVHILALFSKLNDTIPFQKWIDSVMPNIPNDENYFGNQYILNAQDELIEKEERLLLVSLEATLDECVERIHQFGGKAILAHVLDRQNSVTTQLGFIPMDLPYDGLEIKNDEQKLKVLQSHPWIKEDSTLWLVDSDAHRLIDISEAENFMQNSMIQKLWGDEL